MLALALPLVSCADLRGRRVDLHWPAPPAVPGLASPGDWWLAAGDPALAALVARGLASSASLACEAGALAAKPRHASGSAHRTPAAAVAAGYRYADHRMRVVAAIAHAYIDVRRWQSLLALRVEVSDQYRDNAEIAHFRREAGLVSAVDGGLAGALSAQVEGEQDSTRARLERSLIVLANRTDFSASELARQLGTDISVPDLGPSPPSVSGSAPPDLSNRADLRALASGLERKLAREKISQASLDRALAAPVDPGQASPLQDAVMQWRRALAFAATDMRSLGAMVAVADAQLQLLPRRDATAQRNVADARLAYRAGAGDFASLFVAEVAALGVREAMVEARADRAAAIVDLRAASGGGSARAGLGPASGPAAARGGADCE